MAQAVGRRAVTAVAQVWYHSTPSEICGGQSGTETWFLPSTSAFLCQYYSTKAPFTALSLILLLWEGQASDAWEPSIQFPLAKLGQNLWHSSGDKQRAPVALTAALSILAKDKWIFYRFPNMWRVLQTLQSFSQESFKIES